MILDDQDVSSTHNETPKLPDAEKVRDKHTDENFAWQSFVSRISTGTSSISEEVELVDMPFASLDEQLEKFCSTHGFTLEKQPNKRPGHTLRQNMPAVPGLGSSSLDIYLEICLEWWEASVSDTVLYTIGAAKFRFPIHRKRFYKRLTVVKHAPIEQIRLNLWEFLMRALLEVQSWPVPHLTLTDPDASAEGWARTII